MLRMRPCDWISVLIGYNFISSTFTAKRSVLLQNTWNFDLFPDNIDRSAASANTLDMDMGMVNEIELATVRWVAVIGRIN